MTIRLHGLTLSSYVCARCLQLNGVDFEFAKTDDVASHVKRPGCIVVNDVCLALMSDLFPQWNRSGLGTPLTQREVLWGDDPTPRRIEQEALVIETDQLLGELERQIGSARLSKSDDRPTRNWQINPQSDTAFTMTGERTIITVQAKLKTPIDPARSLIESLHDGWIFMAPIDDETAMIQAMCPKDPQDTRVVLESMIAQSVLVAPYIGELNQFNAFCAAPAIRLPLLDQDRIFVAGNAVRLDPISGEGYPFAMRSAILATAMLAHEEPLEGVQSHFVQRTLVSFLSHLQGCFRFYKVAFHSHPDWRQEMHKTYLVHEALSRSFSEILGREFQYNLEGLNLIHTSK